MRGFALPLLLVFAGCGRPPAPGTLTVRIGADPALASALTTEDGWTLKFRHLVVAVSGVGVSGVASPSRPQLIELTDAGVELGSNALAEPRGYDGFTLTLGRATSEDNVNVQPGALGRLGPRPLYVEGTAQKQSTSREFQLTLPMALGYGSCPGQVTVASQGAATIEFRVAAQRLFHDDAGKLRFEAWATADAAPLDGVVTVPEAQAVMTSSLPAAHYGATMGSLQTVLEKRSLSMVGVGDFGPCTGAVR